MAEQKQDLLGRFADLSEGALQRLTEAPGADRVVQSLKALAERVDDLQRRARGFEELEKRMTALEKRVDGLAKPKPARKPKPAAGTHAPKSDASSKAP